jgi:hypothetical protein
MPSKSPEQRKMIFTKRDQYKSKENTPKDWQWVWNDKWTKVEEKTNLTNTQIRDIQMWRIKYGSPKKTPQNAKWIWEVDLEEDFTKRHRYEKFFLKK